MAAASNTLPQWSRDLIALYESHATNQFLLHGNVNDRFIMPLPGTPRTGNLTDYLVEVLLPGFDVILSYDMGNGIRVLKGGKQIQEWPSYQERQPFPNQPRPALETLTHYLRYCANLRKTSTTTIRVAVVLKAAHLMIPAGAGNFSPDVSAMALLVREWSTETALNEHPFACFLLTENLNDLHPLIVNHPRTAHIQVPLPSAEDLGPFFQISSQAFPKSLQNFATDLQAPARYMTGATLSSISSLLKQQEYLQKPIEPRDLVQFKKSLVEKECAGLIEFIESGLSLEAFQGQEPVKTWLRQDIALWQQGDTQAMPMGYLVCGPVGTGKTFLVECLAGEAAVPVVKLKNFRDKWVGSTESNLEKIFRLLQALGRCVVFIDEADQTMGRRNSSGEDTGGVGGRVYSMMAQEMSRGSNRGKILWILASSRPDLIEVDLKRPGRVDVKIPLFPATKPADVYTLQQALCKKYRTQLAPEPAKELLGKLPKLLTPGAAESIAVKVYRLTKTQNLTPDAALAATLSDYQPPVPEEVMNFQIKLAVEEASDLSFVPKEFAAIRKA